MRMGRAPRSGSSQAGSTVHTAPPSAGAVYDPARMPYLAPARRWSIALVGGVFFTLGLFLFLAWLQPVSQNERLELPEVMQFRFQVAPDKKPPPPPEPQRERERPRPEKRPPPKQVAQRPRPQATPRPVRAPTTISAAPIQGLGLRGGLSLAPTAGGGGAVVQLGMDDAIASVASEVLEFERYERARESVRERRQEAMERSQRMAATQPIAVNTPRPPYPSAARRGEIEGYVKLRLLISRTGTVEDHVIEESEPPGVFEAAIAPVLSRWQFRPATDPSGKPIECWIDFYTLFTLKDA